MEFLQKQAFNSIIKRLGGETVAIPTKVKESSTETHIEEIKLPPAADNQYTLINDTETLKAWLTEADKEPQA